MITLKDYIGKIYKDVTNAKVQLDIETLAIAQEYVQNPMLKHFSVPNIRVKNMELTIPVAVDATQPTSRPYTEREVQTAFVNAFNASYLHFFPGKQDSLDALQGDVIQTASASAASSTSELRTANTQSEEAAPLLKVQKLQNQLMMVQPNLELRNPKPQKQLKNMILF